jgi:general secretion pathway protein G
MTHGRSSRNKAAKSQIDLFNAPIQMYQLAIGSYPNTAQGIEALRMAPSDLPNPAKWDGPYLDKPIPLDPWSNPFQYLSPGKHNPKSYDIWSYGPDGVNGTQDDIGNW